MSADTPKLRFQRQEIYTENAKILGKELGEHEGYFRDNNGDWIIGDSEGNRFCVVAFQGTAKRGEKWNAPDPLGMERARLIVRAVNNFDALLEACRWALSEMDRLEEFEKMSYFDTEKLRRVIQKSSEHAETRTQ